MTWLIVIVLAVLLVALYPVVRDFLRKRKSAAPSYVEGLQLALDGRTREAIARLKETVNEDTNNVDAYVRLGDLLFQQGDVDRALRIHENLALRRNLKPREERQVLETLVRDYVRIGRKVRAISILEELALQDRENLAHHEQLLALYIETAAWEKCEELLKSVGKNPADRTRASRMWTEFGRASGKLNPKAAADAFEEALRIDPKSVPARIHLGDHQLRQGDTDAAIRTWNELLTAAPEKNGLVRSRLESAYYELGRYDEVTQLYERLLRRVPDDSGLAAALAAIYRKKQDLPAAIRLLERLGGSDGTDVLVRLALAQAYLESDDLERCRTILDELIARLRDAQPGPS